MAARKKLAIVGRGTAGCLSFLHYNHFNGIEHDVDIEWVYDSNIPTTPVGEGTDMRIPIQLAEKARFDTNCLNSIGGTIKVGIQKEDWGGKGSFMNPFPIGSTGIHMDAGELQKWVFNKFGSKVKTTNMNVSSPDDVDADYVMMATGTPKEFPEDEFYTSEYIPVNAAYVTQCEWPTGFPTFTATLAVARPWGWVFGIPLQHRCSIGYVFNKDISDIKIIKEDVQNVFERYNLVPTEKTNTIHFRNYYRKTPIDERVSHNGNACFFLEPLEATSLSSAYNIDTLTWHHWFGNFSAADVNGEFCNKMTQIEAIICTHYMSGSKYRNAFWDMAQEKGRLKMEQIYQYPQYKDFLKACIVDPYEVDRALEFGTWDRGIWHINAHGLGVADTMLAMN